MLGFSQEISYLMMKNLNDCYHKLKKLNSDLDNSKNTPNNILNLLVSVYDFSISLISISRHIGYCHFDEPKIKSGINIILF